MWNLLNKIFMFHVGRNSSRALARGVGMSRVASLIGLIGGLMYMRRNTH
jgi:hypothetical protein